MIETIWKMEIYVGKFADVFQVKHWFLKSAVFHLSTLFSKSRGNVHTGSFQFVSGLSFVIWARSYSIASSNTPEVTPSYKPQSIKKFKNNTVHFPKSFYNVKCFPTQMDREYARVVAHP